MREKKTYRVATGDLTLEVERNDTGMPLDDVLDVAARANPRRGFLIVSKLIGRHLPTRPCVMLSTMRKLAGLLDADLPGPVVFLGMAETAVGLGQGVHEAWRDATGRDDAWFIQSTRQTHPDMPVWTRFEESHSHATSHLVHRPREITPFAGARTLVIVDDECSTGRTFVAVEEAMREVMPGLRRVVDVAITDWAPETGRERVSLLSGAMTWSPNGEVSSVPGESASAHGATTPGAAAGRTGYDAPPQVGNLSAAQMPCRSAKRVTVIADGENAYAALRTAERLGSLGHDVALQSITRSPAHVGGALLSRALLTDAHGSGATCYSYNLQAHRPDAYVVVAERGGRQAEEIARATGFPLERVHLMEIAS